MILEKANKELCREHFHLFQGTGPDGPAHGENIITTEALPITMPAQVFTQRHFPRLAVQQPGSIAIETQDVADKAPVGWAQNIALLGKNPAQPITGILQSVALVADGKYHRRRPNSSSRRR